jgi:pimeloyl-ACP methyl ester carboxylesterase
VDVGGHLADVFLPSGSHLSGCAAIYLHGVHLARLEANQAFSELFDRHGLRVICPRSGPSWWIDRVFPAFDPQLTPEKYVLERVVPWIGEAWQVEPPRIALFGTSMGGQGALRIGFKHPSRFPVVCAISPAIDFHVRWSEGDEVLAALYDSREAARQDTAILYVHPLAWIRHLWFCCDPADERWYESSEKLAMKLSSMGISHECDLQTSAGGHGWGYYDHMAPAAVEFIVSRLERERLRIV